MDPIHLGEQPSPEDRDDLDVIADAIAEQIHMDSDDDDESQDLPMARRMSLSSMDEFSQRNVGSRNGGEQDNHGNGAPRMIYRDEVAGTTRYRSEGMANRTLALLDRLRQDGQMIDVTLIAGNEHIPAHRAVLAASSPYFYAMFTGFQEKDKTKVHLVDVNPDSLKTLLDYAYKTEVQVTESNVQDLLATSNLLQMTDVRDACCEFLKTQLCASNVIGFHAFADLHGCKSLVEECQSFIDQNFQPVSEGDEFLKLTPDAILKILSSDRLNVVSEEKVYESAMAWVNHDLEARKGYLPAVMERVRMPMLSKEYLVLNVADGGGGLSQNPDCAKFVIEAMKYHMSAEINGAEAAQIDLPAHRIRPRQPVGLPKILLAIGGQAPKAIRSVEGYDFNAEKWIQISEMTTRRCRCGVAVVKGRVYVVGGFNGSLRVRTVDEYDPVADTWTSVASMEARRSTLGVAVLRDCIYAVGGFDGSMGLNSAEVLDLSSVPSASESRRRLGACQGTYKLNWKSIAPMATRRSSVGVGVLGGQIYAVGGYDGNSRQCLQTVEVYEPATNVWTSVADMSARRSGAAVGILNGLLYAVGGHDGPIVRQSVECYNPTANTWTTVAEMNNCRRNAGVVAHGGLLYIIGGDDGSQNLTSVEVYNPKSDTWSHLEASMTLGRSYTGVCVIDRPDLHAWAAEGAKSLN